MAAQTRLSEQQQQQQQPPKSDSITTISAVPKAKSYEKKLLLALKKIVQ